jgi:hypothetical protein
MLLLAMDRDLQQCRETLSGGGAGGTKGLIEDSLDKGSVCTHSSRSNAEHFSHFSLVYIRV